MVEKNKELELIERWSKEIGSPEDKSWRKNLTKEEATFVAELDSNLADWIQSESYAPSATMKEWKKQLAMVIDKPVDEYLKDIADLKVYEEAYVEYIQNPVTYSSDEVGDIGSERRDMKTWDEYKEEAKAKDLGLKADIEEAELIAKIICSSEEKYDEQKIAVLLNEVEETKRKISSGEQPVYDSTEKLLQALDFTDNIEIRD